MSEELQAILGGPLVGTAPDHPTLTDFVASPEEWTAGAEDRLAALSGCRRAVLMASRAQALDVQLRLHGIGEGHKVLLPAGTWHDGTARLLAERRAHPVCFDSEPGRGAVTPIRSSR